METWTIVIFGATGDLTKRKLLPALYALSKQGPEKKHHIKLVCVASEAFTIHELIDNAVPFIENLNEVDLAAFIAQASYHQISLDTQEDFTVLAPYLTGPRIFYCATPADYFATITTRLAQAGFIERGNVAHRIVYEKPFGRDFSSAQEINRAIAPYVAEEQLYRIDHYLTKALVSTIISIRFSNILFEPIMNAAYIDHITVTLDEKIGIEGRGAYYDQYGVIKDVMQNHLLQLIALICMDRPVNTTIAALRAEKIKVLRSLAIQNGVLGQYEGYQQELYVAKNSTTATFAALTLSCNTPRLQGVPIYVRAGKCLKDKLTAITVVFKSVDPCMPQTSCHSEPNTLTITLAPEEGFRLRLNAKKPYSSDELTAAYLDFCYKCLFGPESPKAYELLLQEIMAGDQTISVSNEEIFYQWQFIDTLIAAKLPMVTYVCGSTGPILK